MSDKRTVITDLFEEVSRKFDTRKVLNRASDYSFDESFMQQLQNDGLTFEMLQELDGKVPIFKYMTQITIHGRFPESQVSRIYGYKNCIRNQNETLGLRYNAIDVKKKETLSKRLNLLSALKYPMIPFMKRDSTGIAFQFTSSKLEPVKELYDRIDTSLFYGKKAAWKSAHPFYGVFYVCHINIGVVPAENEWKVFENWTGVSREKWEELRDQRDREKEIEAEEMKLRREKVQAREQENYNAVIAELAGKFPEFPGGDVEGFTLITGLANAEYPGYQTIRFEKGSFGRYKMSRVNKKEFQQPEAIVWDRIKTVTKSDLDLILSKKKWFVLHQTRKEIKAARPVKTAQVNGERIDTPTDIRMIKYSDRSFALFGSGTREIKDQLGRDGLGGMFNRFLTNPMTQEKEPGWIFSIKKEEAVKSTLNIDYATV